MSRPMFAAAARLRRGTLVIALRAVARPMRRSRLVGFVVEQCRALPAAATFWLAAGMLSLSIVLGGGTRSGFLSDALLQLAAIPPLLIAASRLAALKRADAKAFRHIRPGLLFAAAIVLVPLIQLVPLPPVLWTLLPGHAPIAAAYAVVQRSPGWLPISVSPDATMLSALALLPPFAVLFCVMLLDYRERRLLSLLFVALGVVSSFLGLLQISQGPASPLRFFTVTNAADAVGFFANKNHFAALLYAALPFAAVFALDAGSAVRLGRKRNWFEAGPVLPVTLSLLAIVVLIAAEAMARSRAAMALTMVCLLGICALALAGRRRSFKQTPTGLILVAVGIAIVLVLQFGLYRIMQTLGADPLEDSRWVFLRNTVAAAKAYMPFGAGMGTFVAVYAMFEKPADLFAQYINHAHNDFAELWLESGVFGIGLFSAFLLWFVVRAAKIWRGLSLAGSGDLDRLLARAATLVMALLLLHSLVDYPLRTAAIMAVVAFACALMLEPVTGAVRAAARTPAERAASVASAPELPASAAGLPWRPPSTTVVTPWPSKPTRRWGEGVDWPEAWRKPSAGSSAKKPSPQDKPDGK
jgi:O-Antigen ligase